MNTNYCSEVFCYHTERNLQGILYQNPHYNTPKSCLLYFHGGGLLYGVKEDLPVSHLNFLINEGHAVFTFDYRLAPVTKLPNIMDDVICAVEWYIEHATKFFGSTPSYFLWGRSAGAYLCLLAGLHDFVIRPKGIISYYGYGFVTETWYASKNSYYLQFPRVEEAAAHGLIGTEGISSASLSERYALYLYARQMGNWLSYFYHGDSQNFVDNFTLKGEKDFQDYPKTLLAHSIYDPDVPYEESRELASIIPENECFLSFADTHDFDRNTESSETKRLLLITLQFLQT